MNDGLTYRNLSITSMIYLMCKDMERTFSFYLLYLIRYPDNAVNVIEL